MTQIEKEKEFWEFIKLLNDKGFLSNIIIIGSWSEIFYEKKYNYFVNNITKDIDLFYKNLKFNSADKIALSEELSKLGYDVNVDRNNKVATYFKDDFEIEILTEMKGSSDDVNYIDRLGIYSEGLRYLDIIRKNTISVFVNNINILVPNPCAYIIHKLLINNVRKPIEKREKDIDKIKNLLILIRSKEELKKDFLNIYNYTISKYTKAKNLIDECCSKYNIDLSDLIPNICGDLTVYVLENNEFKRKTQDEVCNLLFNGDKKKGKDFWYSLKDYVINQGKELKDCKYTIRNKNNIDFIAGIRLNEQLANIIYKNKKCSECQTKDCKNCLNSFNQDEVKKAISFLKELMKVQDNE